MASVSCNYINRIETMKKSELNKPIVFVVDMINGFIKEGALCDIKIMEIVTPIKELLNEVHPSIFICDAHDLNSKEFDSFPLHCIKGTNESKVIDELSFYAKKIVYKNSTNAFFAPDMKEIISHDLNNYDDIVLVGCCSDICIMQFALTLNTYFNENGIQGKRIIVPINMIETYHISGTHERMKYNEIACDLMINGGIDIVEMK